MANVKDEVKSNEKNCETKKLTPITFHRIKVDDIVVYIAIDSSSS